MVPIPTELDKHLFAIEQTENKRSSVRNVCQLPTLLALELRSGITNQNIESITIWTDQHSFGVPSQDPALWAPTTRERADHALSFCLSDAVLIGEIELATFENSRFKDADIHSMMGRVRIEFDATFSEVAPRNRSFRLEIVDLTGSTHEIERVWASDDPSRLASQEEV